MLCARGETDRFGFSPFQPQAEGKIEALFVLGILLALEPFIKLNFIDQILPPHPIARERIFLSLRI